MSYAQVRSAQVCDVSKLSHSTSDIDVNEIMIIIMIFSHLRLGCYRRDWTRNATYSNRPDRVAQLAEHWASIPKVVGSNPTVARHIFQACPVWLYTQRSNTYILFTWVYNTIIEINVILLDYIGTEATRLSSEISYTRTDLTAELSWQSITKTSIPKARTFDSHIGQAYF